MARSNLGLPPEAIKELLGMGVGAVYDPEYQRMVFERRVKALREKYGAPKPPAQAPSPVGGAPGRPGPLSQPKPGLAAPTPGMGLLRTGRKQGIMERRQASQAQPLVASPRKGVMGRAPGSRALIQKGVMRRKGEL